MPTQSINAPSIEKGRVHKDFTAGMENVPDISAVPDTALSEIINMELDASGALVSRPPVVKVDDFPNTAVPAEMLGYYNRADGETFVVFAHDGKTYLWAPDTEIFTEIAAFAAADCVQYQNRLYLVCRTEAGGWWGEVTSGTGVYTYQSLAGGLTPMPKGDQIVLFKERLWIAGWGDSDERTKVYLSEVTNTIGGDINNWPILNFFYVGRGDGQWITKLHPGPNDLTIFRNASSAYFSYDSDPTLGSLNWYEGKIGCENKHSLALYQNYVYVVSGGALYQMIAYQFYRRNDPAKFEFRPRTSATPYNLGIALSAVGSRMILWYYGSIYVYNVTTNTWSEWESDTDVAILRVIQREEGYSGDDVAYGLSGSGETAKFGVYRMTDGFNFSDSEDIVCRVATKAFDYQTPDRYKTLYWWMADVLLAQEATGTAIPIVVTAFSTTWDDMSLKTWDELESGTWDHPTIKAPGVATDRDIPSGTPSRVSLKFTKKMRFRRVQYELSMTTDGTAASGPVHLFGLVAYMSDNQKINRGVT